MLIRLTSLQQYQQGPHLSCPDELLTFFLQDSSPGTEGVQARKLERREAGVKLGFDPYNESPIKRHSEDYQYQNQDGEQQPDWDSYSRAGTPGEGYRESPISSWDRRSMTPQRGNTTQNQPWLSRNGGGSRQNSPLPAWQAPSSPVSPYRPQQQRKVARPVDRVQREERVKGSPLREGSVNTNSDPDSTLGTEPGSPTLVEKKVGAS